MTAPNIVNVSSIIGKTQGGALATSLGDWVVCPSDKLIKVNSIIVSNVDGVSSANANVIFYDNSATASIHLAKTVTVPAKSTLIVLGKDAPIYLEEGDKIQAQANVPGDLEIIVSFEILDDA